jgi:ATP/maltotriose-dependent transcriptional regulator MalT
VDRHCDNIYAKLGVGSRTEAVVRAISIRLLTVDDGQR